MTFDEQRNWRGNAAGCCRDSGRACVRRACVARKNYTDARTQSPTRQPFNGLSFGSIIIIIIRCKCRFWFWSNGWQARLYVFIYVFLVSCSQFSNLLRLAARKSAWFRHFQSWIENIPRLFDDLCVPRDTITRLRDYNSVCNSSCESDLFIFLFISFHRLGFWKCDRIESVFIVDGIIRATILSIN